MERGMYLVIYMLHKHRRVLNYTFKKTGEAGELLDLLFT